MLMVLKGKWFGFHRIVRETQKSYHIYDKKINRNIVLSKSMWWVIKIPV